jgi:ketosteroid isomerase-like protein
MSHNESHNEPVPSPPNGHRAAHDITKIFADIDSFDPGRFVTHLTDDVVFRFANNPEVTGRAAVEQAITGFFTSIAGLSHHLLQTWEEGDTVIVQADVTYLRQDGAETTVPNADILTFHDGLVRDWRIYIDTGPIYA